MRLYIALLSLPRHELPVSNLDCASRHQHFKREPTTLIKQQWQPLLAPLGRMDGRMKVSEPALHPFKLDKCENLPSLPPPPYIFR